VIRDEVAFIEKAGVSCTPPTKPISYSKLVEELTSLGLFAPSDPAPADGQGGSNLPETAALQGVHLQQVQDFVFSEERASVSDTPPDIDDGSPSAQPGNNGTSPPTSSSELPPPPSVPDYEAAYFALKAEHSKLTTELSRCKQELSRSNTRCLSLENTLASDNNNVTESVATTIKDAMDKATVKLEEKLLRSLSSEMDSAVTKGNLAISVDLAEIHVIRSSLDSSNRQLHNLKETIEEQGALVNNVSREISELGRAIAHSSKSDDVQLTALVTSMQSKLFENQTLIKNKVLANLELLKHALQELSPKSSSTTGESQSMSVASGMSSGGSNSSNTSVRSRSSGDPKRPRPPCTSCGSPAHQTSICPRNRSFCARCLGITHKSDECPHYNTICVICQNNGLADLAIGHTRNVHMESNPQRQAIICGTLSSQCFPGWTGFKRQERN